MKSNALDLLNAALMNDVKKHLHLPKDVEIQVSYEADHPANAATRKIEIQFEIPTDNGAVKRKRSNKVPSIPKSVTGHKVSRIVLC